MKRWMYMLECADGSFYVGSTKDLKRRIMQHQAGKGANHTKKNRPVKLVYYEEFNKIQNAFYWEKQIKGWSRKKKLALIRNNTNELKQLSACRNESHCRNKGGFDSAQPPAPPKKNKDEHDI